MTHNKISKYKDDIENYQSIVRITDFENFFDVYEDKKRNCYTFNLNATMYFNVKKSAMQYATLQHAAYWPQISYMIYSTPRLAWLLMKLNNVKAANMFDIVPTNSKIYYIPTQTMQSIISQIN